MPRNVYFSHGTQGEKHLYEDIIIESLRIYGHECYYIPRTIVNESSIFNEEELSKFGEAYMIEMYVDSVDGYEGDGNLLSKFGLEVRNQISFVLSRKRWDNLIGKFGNAPNELIRPNEGDLIYLPLVKGLFEIRYVDGDTPFYQLQNMPTYKLTCELFEYSNEAIDTGVEEIDLIETNFASRTTLTLGTGTGSFIVGENITQTLSSSPEVIINGEIAEVRNNEVDVVGISSSDGTNVSFSITSGIVGNLVGERSAASYPITLKDSFTPIDTNDAFADNEEFESIGNNFIDFSEINPFGEVNIK
tara:strand:- start:1264 stop:2172 length:909 start_codon:yes stop_codon:yes gene_type:complete